MPKVGEVQIFDDVEHSYGADGQWTPTTPGEKMRKTFINAGKSLGGLLNPKKSDKPGAPSQAEDPYQKAGKTLGEGFQNSPKAKQFKNPF